MTLNSVSSKHLASGLFAAVLLGLVIWMSGYLFGHHSPAVVGTVEVTDLNN